MSDIAICAKCGKKNDLCGSMKINGVQQPKICKNCLIVVMETGDESINDVYWLKQLFQLGDDESINNLKKMKGTKRCSD